MNDVRFVKGGVARALWTRRHESGSGRPRGAVVGADDWAAVHGGGAGRWCREPGDRALWKGRAGVGEPRGAPNNLGHPLNRQPTGPLPALGVPVAELFHLTFRITAPHTRTFNHGAALEVLLPLFCEGAQFRAVEFHCVVLVTAQAAVELPAQHSSDHAPDPRERRHRELEAKVREVAGRARGADVEIPLVPVVTVSLELD